MKNKMKFSIWIISFCLLIGCGLLNNNLQPTENNIKANEKTPSQKPVSKMEEFNKSLSQPLSQPSSKKVDTSVANPDPNQFEIEMENKNESNISNDKDQSVTSTDFTEPVSTKSDSTKIVGYVFDLNGKPLDEAIVAISQSSVAVPEMVEITNIKGEYVWFVPAGSFEVTVHKDGYVSKSSQVTVGVNEMVSLDFNLESN